MIKGVRRDIVPPLLATLAALSIGGCFGGSAVKEGESAVPSLPDELIVSRIDVQVTPMDAINSASDDFCATMPNDTTVLLFTSSRPGAVGKHSIFLSRMNAGVWSSPVPAVEVNNDQSNGTPSIAPGGESMYFTGCDYGLGDCDLYRVGVGPRGSLPPETIPWTIPTNLGLPVNGSLWDSQVCLSADGGALYFSSDRAGGFGGKDIWVCSRDRDGSWSSPINVGEPVNTDFDEVTPWLSPDGRTLFFSSNGHPGLGGFDVFAVEEVAGIRIRSNLGAPVNTRSDEIGFSLSTTGSHAFVSSRRNAGRGYDIFRIEPVPVTIDPLMVVSGTVRAEDGNAGGGEVIVSDLTSNRLVGIFDTDPVTGHYEVVLPRGYAYALTAEMLNHLFRSEQVTVPADLAVNTTRIIDFSVAPIKGSVRLLVFFSPGSAVLERLSSNDLDRAALFLRSNPEVRVEIAGHTDTEGGPDANLKLSSARAEAVRSYLVANHVEAERIQAKGYGATQPIASNDTEDGRAQNRRVEMRILPAGK